MTGYKGIEERFSSPLIIAIPEDMPIEDDGSIGYEYPLFYKFDAQAKKAIQLNIINIVENHDRNLQTLALLLQADETLSDLAGILGVKSIDELLRAIENNALAKFAAQAMGEKLPEIGNVSGDKFRERLRSMHIREVPGRVFEYIYSGFNNSFHF